jgi:GNAT superfamily N-acetyltransferase
MIQQALKEISILYPFPTNYVGAFIGPTYILVCSSEESIHKKYIQVESIFIVGMHVNKKDRGKGIGSKMLKDICNIADKYHLAICMRPSSISGGLTQHQLIKWYQRSGFIWLIKNFIMIRKEQSDL